MPIYEYECRSCSKEFQFLVMNAGDEKTMVCPECRGQDLRRVMSRVAFHLSEDARLDSFDPGARQSDSFYQDSRNIGLAAKKKAQQMGVDLGSSFENKVEKLRTDPGSVLDGD